MSVPDGETRRVLFHDVDLTVEVGDRVAIMGRSGTGKSTLLSALAGLNQPDRGSIYLNGVDMSAASGRDRAAFRASAIGVVTQDSSLLASLTVAENVAFPMELCGAGHGDALRDAQALLDRVGLPDRGRSFPGHLSGGERQRAAIARAIAGKRNLVLADEPTGNLDATTAAEITELLLEVSRDGVAVVVVTHDLRVAEAFDRTLELRVDGLLDSAGLLRVT